MLACNLSVSERALTGIARAIIASPMILIADEPLLHLDEQQKKTVTELLLNMHAHGTTLVLLSRDTATAQAFRARTVELKNGSMVQARKKEAEKKHAIPAKDTHRILEEAESAAHHAPEHHDEENDLPKTKNGGRKIRITSIGSGL